MRRRILCIRLRGVFVLFHCSLQTGHSTCQTGLAFAISFVVGFFFASPVHSRNGLLAGNAIFKLVSFLFDVWEGFFLILTFPLALLWYANQMFLNWLKLNAYLLNVAGQGGPSGMHPRVLLSLLHCSQDHSMGKLRKCGLQHGGRLRIRWTFYWDLRTFKIWNVSPSEGRVDI